MNSKLHQVKLLHTIIWTVMVAAIFQILYAGLSGRISMLILHLPS